MVITIIILDHESNNDINNIINELKSIQNHIETSIGKDTKDSVDKTQFNSAGKSILNSSVRLSNNEKNDKDDKNENENDDLL